MNGVRLEHLVNLILKRFVIEKNQIYLKQAEYFYFEFNQRNKKNN